MKTKTLLAALILAAAPTMSMAMGGGCSFGHEKEQIEEITMSCGEGTSFDADAGKCVPLTTS